MQKESPAEEQEANFAPDVFIVPAVVMLNPEVQPLDAKLYAIIYWLERLKDGRCWASNKMLGKLTNSSSGGVANSLSRLKALGYVDCIMDAENNHRKQIRTLVHYNVYPSSNDEGGVHQMMNIKNNIKNKYTSDELTDIKKVYITWLRYFLLTPEQRAVTEPSARKSLLQDATNRCKLTDTRKAKIHARIKSMGLERVTMAVVALSESDFHRGDNDRGWQATLEWLCAKDEKVEEWSNKFKEGLL